MTNCEIDDYPDARVHHTNNGVLTCGGLYTQSTCLTLTNGKWLYSHNLTNPRWGHSSWSSKKGVVLIGGYHEDSLETTEIVDSESAITTVGFTLKYQTKYTV